MDTVFRALAIYLGLMIILRGSGQRSLAQITSFDFVLLLILGESTQQALVGDDFSVTTGVLLIASLVGIDMTLAWLKQFSGVVDRFIEGLPLVIVEDGRPLLDRMRRSRVDESDVLAAARERQGLERMEQIKYAVLERSGGISIIPR
ncbi:MAG: DUF421 domain-containing protein [Vicinamibacterales bacterium]